MGKSTLANEASRQAGARGFTVAPGRGRDAERAAPGSALRSAIIRCAPAMSERREAGELIGNFLSLAPAALVLDDAHLVDELSLRMVNELADRISSRPILLVIATSTHLMDPSRRGMLDALRAADHCRTIKLGALDDAGATELIRAALPGADSRFCLESGELTGRNPFLLAELAAWVGAHRIEPVAGAARHALAPLPPLTIREFVRRQLDDAGEDAGALAAAIAISERPLTLGQAAGVVGLTGDRSLHAAEALLETGLIAPGEVLSFAAPLTADCLRADTPSAVSADLHRRMAELALSGEVAAESSSRHLLLAAPSGRSEVVDRLVQLADDEVAGGNLGQARTLIRRAIAEQVDGEAAKPQLVARLGLVDLLDGRPGSTPTLAAAIAALDSSRDRADALLKLGVSQVAAGAPARGVVLVRRRARAGRRGGPPAGAGRGVGAAHPTARPRRTRRRRQRDRATRAVGGRRLEPPRSRVADGVCLGAAVPRRPERRGQPARRSGAVHARIGSTVDQRLPCDRGRGSVRDRR
jgi:hypothetical protein